MYELASERWSPVQSVEKVILSVISMLAGTSDQTSMVVPGVAILTLVSYAQNPTLRAVRMSTVASCTVIIKTCVFSFANEGLLLILCLGIRAPGSGFGEGIVGVVSLAMRAFPKHLSGVCCSQLLPFQSISLLCNTQTHGPRSIRPRRPTRTLIALVLC
jgi:hypothetical protein